MYFMIMEVRKGLNIPNETYIRDNTITPKNETRYVLARALARVSPSFLLFIVELN